MKGVEKEEERVRESEATGQSLAVGSWLCDIIRGGRGCWWNTVNKEGMFERLSVLQNNILTTLN